MKERDKQIAMMAVASTLTNREIAKRVGCHPNTLTRVLKKPEVRAYMQEIQQAVEEKTIVNLAEAFDLASPEAFHKLLTLMREGSGNVAFKALESILDRSQVAPKRQIHSKHQVDQRVVTLNLSKSEIDRMHQVLIDDARGDTANIPPKPQLQEDEEYIAVFDGKGNVVKEAVRKIRG